MRRVEILGEPFDWDHVSSISEIDEKHWDTCADGHPLVRHAFFRALESSGSLGIERGVVPGYFLLRDHRGTLVAAVPTVLKWGGLREFGPEIFWLQKGLDQGCFQWPKFQACSPFYPQIAPKLLIHPDRRSPSFRAAVLRLVLDLGAAQFPTFSLMHISADDADEFARQGALISREPGSGWTNPGVSTFEEYVDLLPARKRRKLRRERAYVAGLGLSFAVHEGAEVTTDLIDLYCTGHRNVCRRHGGGPWLPPAVYQELCQRMPDAVRLLTAYRGEMFVAAAFCFRSADTLYLQTWSSIPDVPGLCFEMLCYAPIEYAITHGLKHIDAGLSIPYKNLRGYPTQPVFNAHWFFDERLEALARSEMQGLLQVGQQVGDVLDADRQPHEVVGNLQL